MSDDPGGQVGLDESLEHVGIGDKGNLDQDICDLHGKEEGARVARRYTYEANKNSIHSIPPGSACAFAHALPFHELVLALCTRLSQGHQTCCHRSHRITSTVTAIGFDSAFTSDRSGATSDTAKEEDAGPEDESIMKILTAHDGKSEACATIPVPKRGIDSDECAVRESLRCLDVLGN